ncbi:MAG: spermidine synthase, partial [Fimbriiglobus sp.]
MPRLDLLVASATILFLELALIRWLPAHVLFLSFFTNTVLLACFVGMSVGCLTAGKPGREIRRTPYWLLLALAAGLTVQVFRAAFERHTDVGNQLQPEVVFFGTELSALKAVEFTVPVEIVAGVFFVLAAAVMVGPGQELGRALVRVRNRTTAYSLDLLGSLGGIAAFAACSDLQLPPVVWFAVAGLGIKVLLRGEPGNGPRFAVLGCVALTAITSGLWTTPRGVETFWSPYYRVDYEPESRFITTNQISHQLMQPRGSPTHALYEQPYLFQRATGRPPFRRVLIIGAGSGNDLARALYWCPSDARIDAVEIDPVIQRIGAADNPDRPYQDPRVTVHLTDGRNFLRRAPDAEYDLVVFALVDSLVLHSGYSNIRLESYLFTAESFAVVARVLKPDGQAAVYNYFRHGWIVARLRDHMRAAFGTDPVTITVGTSENRGAGGDLALDEPLMFSFGFTALFAGRPDGIDPLKRTFAANGNTYWIPTSDIGTERPGQFGATPPTADPKQWVPLRPARVAEADDLPHATDDWPFLYVRRPGLPTLTLRGMALSA